MDDREIMPRSTNEINTLFMLSKSLTEVLDTAEVLERVVESAQYLTNADEGMILLPEGDELYLRAKVGPDIEQLSNFRVKTKDTLAGHVFQTGQPILVGASGPQKIKTEYLVNSLLYVPIILKGEVIGVLGVNNRRKKDQFSNPHKQLLQNLASFAAIALENARIHQESLERSHDLETLVNVGEVLNDSLSLSDTLLRICKQLFDILSVHHVEVLRWEPKTHALHTLACYDRIAWRFGHGPRFIVDDQPALRKAISTDQNQWLSLNASSVRATVAEHALLKKMNSETMLLVPIKLQQKSLGCFRFFYTQSPTRPPSDSMLQQVHHSGLDNLVELLSSPNPAVSDRLLKALMEMNQMTGADWCDLILPVKSGPTFMVLVRVGNKVWVESPLQTLNLNDYTDLSQALGTMRIIEGTRHSRGAETSGVQALLEKSQTDLLLGLPLIRGGQSQGLVVLASTESTRVFSRREINIARTIVGQAAAALENATLVHDLEQSLRTTKNAQERLVQTARLSAMGELAMVVAHQINNPLTTIIADTDLLLMDEPEDSSNREVLETIARTGRRAANVARRLLAIARPIDPSARPDAVNVIESLQEIMLLLRAHIERKSIIFRQNFPPYSLPPVLIIKGQLADVWINLLMNAYDALDGQRQGQIGIDVAHRPEKRVVEVVIWDNGPGIAANLQSQIFSPFFTTKPAGEGTGIGLHICREIVENAGGTISVESQPNTLTRFIVSLPVGNIGR
jgi:signal transduction histidine kinase/putative methionine-R-sulfoxide reductase with GAF domain